MGSNQFFIDFLIFLKNQRFLSSGIGSGPSRMAPWNPWIDTKMKKKVGFLGFFDHFFIFDPWPAIIDHLDL